VKISSAIASDAVCAVKFVNSFARRKHLFDIAAKPIDVDWNILSYPIPVPFLLCPKCNHNIYAWCILPPVIFVEIRSVFLRN